MSFFKWANPLARLFKRRAVRHNPEFELKRLIHSTEESL
jgi:hypothetical protein